MKQKSALFEIQLNSISSTDNPTKKEIEFILHDFELSKNGAFISKDTALKAFDSLSNTPLVAKYYPNSDTGSGDDALGTHEASLGVTRDGENYYVDLQTTPIGVFTEPAYLKTIEDESGNKKEVVAGKGVIWASRFPNVVGLLQEWIDNGITVSSSMEILYDEYLFKDGVEEILNFVYEGHCVLNSQERGEHAKVEPAYDVSKLTRLVAQAMNQSNTKEDEQMPEKFQKVFELSHNDIRTALYQVLDAKLEANQYSWIRDVYETKFIAEIDTVTEDDYKSETFKFDFSKSEDDKISIDFESKVAVMKKTEWIELEETKQLQAEIKEKDETIQALSSEKEGLQNQFNDATEKLTSLNSEVNELKEYKEKYDADQFEKQLSEKQELYSAKFSALGASEKYDSEEVQELVKEAVSSEDAVTQLNSMIVDLITAKEEEKVNKSIVQLNNKRQNLVPTETDFDSRYK